MARLDALAHVCPVPDRRHLPCFDLTRRDLLLSLAAFFGGWLAQVSRHFFPNFRSTMTKRKVPVPITSLPSWIAPPKLKPANSKLLTTIHQGINTKAMTKNPIQKLCGSCQMNPGVKLVPKGRGGKIKTWRCLGCLTRRQPSWISGK